MDSTTKKRPGAGLILLMTVGVLTALVLLAALMYARSMKRALVKKSQQFSTELVMRVALEEVEDKLRDGTFTPAGLKMGRWKSVDDPSWTAFTAERPDFAASPWFENSVNHAYEERVALTPEESGDFKLQVELRDKEKGEGAYAEVAVAMFNLPPKAMVQLVNYSGAALVRFPEKSALPRTIDARRFVGKLEVFNPGIPYDVGPVHVERSDLIAISLSGLKEDAFSLKGDLAGKNTSPLTEAHPPTEENTARFYRRIDDARIAGLTARKMFSSSSEKIFEYTPTGRVLAGAQRNAVERLLRFFEEMNEDRACTLAHAKVERVTGNSTGDRHFSEETILLFDGKPGTRYSFNHNLSGTVHLIFIGGGQWQFTKGVATVGNILIVGERNGQPTQVRFVADGLRQKTAGTLYLFISELGKHPPEIDLSSLDLYYAAEYSEYYGLKHLIDLASEAVCADLTQKNIPQGPFQFEVHTLNYSRGVSKH